MLATMDILLIGVDRAPTVRDVLPALDLLPHTVTPAVGSAVTDLMRLRPDVVLVDARAELAGARSTCQLLRSTGLSAGLIAVVTEGGLAVVADDWGIDDLVLTTAGPAEVSARLRLAAGGDELTAIPDTVRNGDLVIEPGTYSARLRGRQLDLTYKEFELLRFLAQHPGRVFTREQLLRQVWGFDYFGGVRTVDVHVRRLRAKLGSEYEGMIGTVRNVGYRFVAPPRPLPQQVAR